MKDSLFSKSKFPWVLGVSALFIALCAAFFSVYGISTLFAGAFISTVVMASSLEIGKLVGVTFLYRYWSKCKLYLKGYLVTATFILMLITSLGIFGYLSAAYQKSSIEYAVTQDKIKITEQQIAFSQQSIDTLINLRTSQNTNQMNEMVIRNPLLFKQFQQQIADTDANIEKESKKKQSLIDNVNTLKLGTAEKKDVQIFKFVSDALGLPLDTVARWFIIMIIFVFDPLAICLILAYNVAVYRREDSTVYDTPEPIKPQEPPKRVVLRDADPPKEEDKIVLVDATPQVEEPKPVIAPTTETVSTPPLVSENLPVTSSKSDNTFFNQYFKI